MIGVILGNRYELVQVIGEGGMAIVYKAKDKKLNRWVAVKVLKKEFADNIEIADKFRKEATAIANLSDMNIVNVLDVGHEEDDNVEYFVMEYVDGKTLKDIIIFNGKLSYTTAISIGIQIAKALDCAHRNNIIHRDVKPQNILVTEHGDVKVTDFGIAKSSTSSTITNTTTIMGSAHYLSPEQAKGTFIDVRTDIYSLGIVLYEMVTGKLPFQGESPVTIALKHIQEQPVPPKNINNAIPESFNSLIIKAIQKEPLSRYQNAKEIIADLQKIKDNPDIEINKLHNNDEDGRTIIMSPIKVDEAINMKKQSKFQSKNQSDFNDAFEDDDDNFKSVGKKKNFGKIFAIITIITILGILGVFAFDTFNKGNNEVVLPNIIGKNFDEAKVELQQLGLELQNIGTKVSDEAEGIILESNPVAESILKKDAIVKVIVSGGVEKVKVPDLRDREINYIKQLLDQRGIKYEITEVFDDKIEEGYLVTQEPERDTEITKEDIMKISISKGPEVKLVLIENYIGMKAVDIKAKLEKLKIVVTIIEVETDRENENGIVLKQSLTAGKKIEEGTEMELTVGKYVEPKIDVRKYISEGMYLGDAISALKAATIEYEVVGGIPPKEELNNYLVVSFNDSISKGEKVKLHVEKTQKPPSDNGTNP